MIKSSVSSTVRVKYYYARYVEERRQLVPSIARETRFRTLYTNDVAKFVPVTGAPRVTTFPPLPFSPLTIATSQLECKLNTKVCTRAFLYERFFWGGGGIGARTVGARIIEHSASIKSARD